MDRLRRLQSLWGWLPTFRAVAEHESVSRAAEQLAVSPSAVSRMIGLLENDIGQPLFARVGRNVELNEAGRHLLAGARSAMRLVDESLAAIAGNQMVGRVRITSREPITRAFLLPALTQLRSAHPALEPELSTTPDGDAAPALLRGDLDVALLHRVQGIERQQVSVRLLGELPCSVYASKRHSLAKLRRLSASEVLPHPFVAVAGDQGSEGWWPLTFRRRVAMRVACCDLAAEVASCSEHLVALPDVAASHHNRVRRRQLVRLHVGIVEPVKIYAVWRQQLELAGRAEAVVNAVEAVIAQGARQSA